MKDIEEKGQRRGIILCGLCVTVRNNTCHPSVKRKTGAEEYNEENRYAGMEATEWQNK
jgi:hypothetical protein